MRRLYGQGIGDIKKTADEFSSAVVVYTVSMGVNSDYSTSARLGNIQINAISPNTMPKAAPASRSEG